MQREDRVRQRLLVVEDDGATGRALSRPLRFWGYEVRCVQTVAQALAALEGQDAVLLDLMLPDGSGAEVLSRIRRDRLPQKVLVLTGLTDPRVLDDVARLRPDGVLQKPHGIEQLKAWLEANLNAPN
jgi:two-component system response regulator QseB